MVPPAVAGRWRWVTTPPTSTLAPGGTAASPSAETAPSSSSRSRANCTGWLSPDSPVAHRSAAPSSTGLIPGSRGASAPTAVPGSRSALAWATAPAAHNAARRSSPSDPNAPAVASASTCPSPTPVRRTRSAIDAYGRPAATRSASSSPSDRTYPSPSRTASSPSPPSSVAVAAERLTSGPWTATPWRRASATRVLGDQKPIGWALSRAARNAAG